MRFLFGIFTGAALTLLIATATDAPTSPVLKELSGIWQELIDATGDQLFRHSTAAEVTELELEHMAQRRQDNRVARVEDSVPASEPALSERSGERTPTQTLAATERTMAEHVKRLPESPAPTPPSPAAIELQVTRSTSPMSAIEYPLAGDQLAAVWVPFHSERSASGFARSLSRHFEYPFSVRRAGPGAYQVIFPYASPDQRENMLMEIAELTGQ